MARKKKAELRLYIAPSLDRLLKTLSGLSDQTVSSIVEDTLRESLPDRYSGKKTRAEGDQSVCRRRSYSLLKRLAGVREQSLNYLMNEMIEDWLALDKQQETIDRHRLDETEED